MKLTPEMLTGKSRKHLINLPTPHSPNHFLQAEAMKAFKGLQQSAVKNGFNLQPASSFRDFERQQLIWNGKFNGERKVHDDAGNPLDLALLDDWQKAQAILRWSALPGGSRHHWGTEIDIFDPDLLPQGQSLQLSEFLTENLPHFDFALPFISQPEGKKIGREPWHISYLPLAELASQLFTLDVLLQVWQNEKVEGKETLITHLPEIFEQYVV